MQNGEVEIRLGSLLESHASLPKADERYIIAIKTPYRLVERKRSDDRREERRNKRVF